MGKIVVAIIATVILEYVGIIIGAALNLEGERQSPSMVCER